MHDFFYFADPLTPENRVRDGARHGPTPGLHEAKAEAFSNLEAEAFTHFSLEAEALVTKPKPKPKPGYLYSIILS